MEHNIAILFYTRISRKNKNNQVPIYLRITVNGKRIEHTTNRSIDPSKWSSSAGRMKGSHAEARTLNGFLDAMRNRVHAIERGMAQDGITITYESFKEKWFGIEKKNYMLLEILNNTIMKLYFYQKKIFHLQQ